MKAKARKPKNKIKMKTKRTFAKRVKISGSGKMMTSHNYISHFAANKTHKQKMHLRKPTEANHTDYKRDKQLLQG